MIWWLYLQQTIELILLYNPGGWHRVDFQNIYQLNSNNVFMFLLKKFPHLFLYVIITVAYCSWLILACESWLLNFQKFTNWFKIVSYKCAIKQIKLITKEIHKTHHYLITSLTALLRLCTSIYSISVVEIVCSRVHLVTTVWLKLTMVGLFLPQKLANENGVLDYCFVDFLDIRKWWRKF